MENQNKPNFFSIKMFQSVSFQSAEKLNQILDVFESHEKFIPTKWGSLETISLDYNRKEIIDKVSTGQPGFPEVYLNRRQSVKYSGNFDTYWNSRAYLNFEFDKSMPKKLWGQFFEISDQIATIAQPRYGLSHIVWPAVTPWQTEKDKIQKWMNASSYPKPVNFIPNGPLGLGLRTYFSGDVLEMFGRDLLLSAPAIVKELEWGGIRIDLVERLWEADIDTILDQWLKTMKHLETANVIAIPDFDEDGRSVNFSPNIEWEKWLERD